jgi:hypothetical protein
MEVAKPARLSGGRGWHLAERNSSEPMSECCFPMRNTGLKSTLLPDGYLVIANKGTGEAVTLNPMGALIWEFCDGNNSIDDIVVELLALGAPAVPTLHEDIRSLLEEMGKSGLLTLQKI